MATKADLDFNKVPMIKYDINEKLVNTYPVSWESVSILWKPDVEGEGDDVRYHLHTDPKRGAFEERVFNIRQKLIEKVPQLKETLEHDYAMLHHDDTCQYNPYNIETKEADVLAYGHELHLERADQFFSTEIAPLDGEDEIRAFEEANAR